MDCLNSAGAVSPGFLGALVKLANGEVAPRMIRAVTWMDSGLPRGAFCPSNMVNLLAIEPDLSRVVLGASGVGSRERSGVGGWRVTELARSATEGDFDGSLVLCFRTVKKVEDGVVGLGRSSFGLPDSASKALMRCEMLDPTLPFFDWILALDGLRVRLFKNVAPFDDTLLGMLPWDMSTGMRSDPRIGLDAARGKRGSFLGGLPGLGKTGVMGDLETSIGFASCTVAVCNSSIKASSSKGSEGSI